VEEPWRLRARRDYLLKRSAVVYRIYIIVLIKYRVLGLGPLIVQLKIRDSTAHSGSFA
jgi:hypothetical protein